MGTGPPPLLLPSSPHPRQKASAIRPKPRTSFFMTVRSKYKLQLSFEFAFNSAALEIMKRVAIFKPRPKSKVPRCIQAANSFVAAGNSRQYRALMHKGRRVSGLISKICRGDQAFEPIWRCFRNASVPPGCVVDFAPVWFPTTRQLSMGAPCTN